VPNQNQESEYHPLYSAREMEHQFNDAEVKTIVVITNFASCL